MAPHSFMPRLFIAVLPFAALAAAQAPIETAVATWEGPISILDHTAADTAPLFGAIPDQDDPASVIPFAPVVAADPLHDGKMERRALGKAWTGTSRFANAGVSGVSAQQIAVVDDDHIVIYDKAEHNPLMYNGRTTWGAVYTISSASVRPLNMVSNSFCAAGGFLSNGTLVSPGGNPSENLGETVGNGLQAIRSFTPCGNGNCQPYEHPRIRLTSKRWYPSVLRLPEGGLLIMGGMTTGGFNNVRSTDNPTYEFYPPRNIHGYNGLPIPSPFLARALNTNLFPITFLLPNGQVFVAANKLAMIYDYNTNRETMLPGFPGGVRVNYPASAAAALLPLTVANKYTPEVLICGGTTANTDGSPTKLSSKTPATNKCFRMAITSAGIRGGWKTETMPEARIMGSAVLTPDGKVLLVNGAATGVAGYGNVPDQVGQSNARNPVFRPTLYDPVEAAGRRFSTNFPSSRIERLYHSVASLLPDGRILVTGSNPNKDVTTTTYRTRFEVEILSPPYVSVARPTFSGFPANILNKKVYTFPVTVPAGTKKVQAVILDLGFNTHGFTMNSRYVELASTYSNGRLQTTGVATTKLYPPGPAWLYVLADGVPSKGRKIMIGNGAGPAVDHGAIANMLARTTG